MVTNIPKRRRNFTLAHEIVLYKIILLLSLLASTIYNSTQYTHLNQTQPNLFPNNPIINCVLPYH